MHKGERERERDDKSVEKEGDRPHGSFEKWAR